MQEPSRLSNKPGNTPGHGSNSIVWVQPELNIWVSRQRVWILRTRWCFSFSFLINLEKWICGWKHSYCLSCGVWVWECWALGGRHGGFSPSQRMSENCLSDQNAKMPLAAHPSLSPLKKSRIFLHPFPPARPKIDCDYWRRPTGLCTLTLGVFLVISTQESLNTVLKTHNMSPFTPSWYSKIGFAIGSREVVNLNVLLSACLLRPAVSCIECKNKSWINS